MVCEAFSPKTVPVRDVAAALVCIGRGFNDFKDALGDDKLNEFEGWVSGF